MDLAVANAIASNDSEFTYGEVYFCAYFVDKQMHFPFVGSYVYLGKDLLGTEQASTCYFQDCESYATHGSFLSASAAESVVLGLTGEAVASMVTLDQLFLELRFAEQRRLSSQASKNG